MNKRQQAALADLVKCEQALRAHCTIDRVRESPALEALTEFIGQAKEYSGSAERSWRDARRATRQLFSAVKALRELHMRPIAEIAAEELTGLPEAAALRLPGAAVSRRELVLAGHAMAAATRPWASTFEAAGLGPDFVDKLIAAISVVDNLEIMRYQHRRAAVGAARAVGPALAHGVRARRRLKSVMARALSEYLYPG